jgi:hypothetical protein
MVLWRLKTSEQGPGWMRAGVSLVFSASISRSLTLALSHVRHLFPSPALLGACLYRYILSVLSLCLNSPTILSLAPPLNYARLFL